MEKQTYLDSIDIYTNIFMYNNVGNINISLEIYININIKNYILNWIWITGFNYLANDLDI
jgi:hypothetical protein